LYRLLATRGDGLQPFIDEDAVAVVACSRDACPAASEKSSRVDTELVLKHLREGGGK
jgi:hypothetical protein